MFEKLSKSIRWGLICSVAGIAPVLVYAAPANADVILTGSYDNNSSGDGYDTTSGTYDVPADVGGVPSATFNGNSDIGLFLMPGTTVNVAGGQFDDNQDDGIDNAQGTLNITGGEILGNAFFTIVNGGGTTNLYGQFNGLTPGQTEDITSSRTTITGTLENDTTAQSFLLDNSGNVYVHDVAVPEPASLALVAVAMCGLLSRRRRLVD